jgi:hypothetical protein
MFAILLATDTFRGSTTASLRDKGVVDDRRGVLTIKNTKKLDNAACECFEALSLRAGADVEKRPSVGPRNQKRTSTRGAGRR